MIGHRLPDHDLATFDTDLDLTVKDPGAYVAVTRPDGSKWWWVCDPLGNWGTLQHDVTEHDDGTITVHPSIFDAPNGYHGWLVKGVWSDA